MLNFKLFLESELTPIPVLNGRVLWAGVKKITGLPFKNKRFTGEYSYIRDTVESGKYQGAELAISGGILVVQHFGGIPNFKELVDFLKKHFGDVHVKGDEYINCREWGREYYVPTGSIELKDDLEALPNPEQFTSGKLTVKAVAGAIDVVSRSRECKVIGKPHAQCKVIAKLGLTEQLVSWENHLFVVQMGHFYQVRDASEARQFVRLLGLRLAALRQAEVSSWSHGDMSNPNG